MSPGLGFIFSAVIPQFWAEREVSGLQAGSMLMAASLSLDEGIGWDRWLPVSFCLMLASRKSPQHGF